MQFYKLILKSDGLYLQAPQGVFNQEEKNKLFEMLSRELKLRNIKCNTGELNTWFFQTSPEPIKISEDNEFEKKSVLDLKISKDQLAAYLTFYPSLDGSQLTLNEVKRFLLEKGIKYGIDDVKIMVAVAGTIPVHNLLVAKGKKPVPGNDAEIKFYFSQKGLEIKPKELENGNVDFYNINLIQNVKKGQLLFEKIPASRGNPGMSVFGNELKAKDGKDLPLPIGKNISLSEDDLKGYAACEGHVVYVDGKVSVLSTYEVNGDVNFSTGNIDFNGNVVIKGNINNGFTVKATGDVEVYGTVEGGHVQALGNIFIRKGIRGLKKSKITAQGSVYSNFIEHATVKAGVDVIVNEAIMHSNIISGHIIQVGGKKGLVVGGNCIAGKALICKNIGSNFATLTNVEVGINPELRKEYKEVCCNLVATKENLDKTFKALKILDALRKKQQLSHDKEVLEQKLKTTKEELLKQQDYLMIRKLELEKNIKELEEGYVKVSGTVYCGVCIAIGKAKKHFTKELYKVHLTQQGVDINISPLTAEK